MVNHIDIQIGSNLSRERRLALVSPDELAVKMGLSVLELARVEAGTRTLGAVEMCEVCRALNIPVARLLAGV
jgi:transcriptional regulator with XRE-family HTH domain